MVSRTTQLPTREQCLNLSDEQCRRIQEYRDPECLRAHQTWELRHQPELLRLYMTMLSFKRIEEAMRSKLNWTYKTYANRFRDWQFPIQRSERKPIVAELFALVSNSSASPPTASLPATPTRIPIRQIQPQPVIQSNPQPPVQPQPYTALTSFLFSTSPELGENRNLSQDRMSVSTTGTWASGSGSSAYTLYDCDTLENHRFSVATTSSSMSASSQNSFQTEVTPHLQTQPQRRPDTTPRHDPRAGRWNEALRVVPCQRGHSLVMWHDETFAGCPVCGFSRWHALMLHARSIPIDVFVAAMIHLRGINTVDVAGNYPVHFLMAAGVTMDYFVQLYRWPSSSGQNAFGQNPLHVLNPQDLGEQLINFLVWFDSREAPPGLLLAQRDIDCRTPLYALLQHPLERSLYQRILKIDLPIFAEHQLRSLDTSGNTAIRMMHLASQKLRSSSPSDYGKIQAGISETHLFMSSHSNSNSQRYGFHDIARGARGTSYHGFFQCKICDQINGHGNCYLEQMRCASESGRDRNAPDEMGLTPAHAIVTQARCNNDAAQTPETAAQTAELFRILIPSHDPTLREALHVLDPMGNSLIYNIAVRGLDEILRYALDIEDSSRRSSMVNACSAATGKERSVLEAVARALLDVRSELRISENTGLKEFLREKEGRLVRCRDILLRHNAVWKPSPAVTWGIGIRS